MPSVLDQILETIVNRKGEMSGNTLIPANHLAQMRLFGIRQGVELYPDQDDDYDTRKKFIENIWKQNQLDLFLERIWDYTLCKGQTLLYLRPTKDGTYKVYFYKKDNFRAYYNADGDLSEVVIRYSYKMRSRFDSAQNIRWIKIRITPDTIDLTQTDQQPAFDGEYMTNGNTQTFENTLKFIPCVVVKNSPGGPGEDGVGEFEGLRSQIEQHDAMMSAINDNLSFFGNPSLVTTRSPNEIMEAIETETPALNRSRTLSSAGGWYSQGFQDSTRKADPFAYRAGSAGIRVKRVVGNVSGEERFGYIAPDPISPDHAQHVRELREAIHFALGGIDERGISASATAYEMKSIYGRLAATAGKKCKALYEHGLCKLFEMAIAAEEDLFKQSLAAALKKDPAEVTDGFIQDLMAKGKMPPNVFGIPPLGNRLIRWRWTGPVFEDSPQDMQSKSIVCRNMQELGVRSLEALKVLFANKTDKELEGMLRGGYPFRYMSSVANTTQQMIGLYQAMLNVPDETGKLPLAASIPLAPLISRSIQTLYQELDYDPGLDPVQPGDVPDYDTGYSNYSAFLNPAGVPNSGAAGNAASAPVLPTSNNSLSYPSPLAASGITAPAQSGTGQPLEGSVQQRGRIPEYASDIPTAGSTVTTDNTPIAGNTQPQQSILGSQLPQSTSIPPDLAIGADQPGSIWQQLFPTFTAAAKSVSKRSRKK